MFVYRIEETYTWTLESYPPMLLHWEKDWLLFEHGKDNRHRKKQIYSMWNYIRKNNISMLMKTRLLGLFLLYALVLFPLYSSIFFFIMIQAYIYFYDCISHYMTKCKDVEVERICLMCVVGFYLSVCCKYCGSLFGLISCWVVLRWKMCVVNNWRWK